MSNRKSFVKRHGAVVGFWAGMVAIVSFVAFSPAQSSSPVTNVHPEITVVANMPSSRADVPNTVSPSVGHKPLIDARLVIERCDSKQTTDEVLLEAEAFRSSSYWTRALDRYECAASQLLSRITQQKGAEISAEIASARAEPDQLPHHIIRVAELLHAVVSERLQNAKR
jgi:hypothetical protein